MKITCTEEEKNKLMDTFYRADDCPIYPGCECIFRDECFKCMNEHIEWEVVDDNN